MHVLRLYGEGYNAIKQIDEEKHRARFQETIDFKKTHAQKYVQDCVNADGDGQTDFQIPMFLYIEVGNAIKIARNQQNIQQNKRYANGDEIVICGGF